MIEIMFTEGAAGSMQYAKSAKNIIGGSTGVIFVTDIGHDPTPEEIAREQARVEEEFRKKQENAVAMEGSTCDVACFPLNLSVGDISEPFSDKRADFLQSTVLIAGAQFENVGRELMDAARKSLEKVLSAVEAGQPVRIWTSRNPDELCGFCHLLSLLPEKADVRVVELPAYEVTENGLCTYSGWGDVDSMELGRLQTRARPLTDMERRYFATAWRDLQAENGPLRAVVNGKLCTVGADFYDGFILRELEKQPQRFHEGRLIGEILNQYPLGLGDFQIALRFEAFISRGMLTPATTAAEGCPIYHRYLRKDG